MGLQVAPPVDPQMPKACSTDFASTVGKRPAFQAAFYFGSGLVSLDASSAEAPFGLGPLAAGAQRFTAVATCDLLLLGQESGRMAPEQAPAAAVGASGKGAHTSAIASPMSDGAGSLLCDEQLQSPDSMEICGDRGSSEQRGRLPGRRRSCASPGEEQRSPRGHQHHMLGLSPLLGRSLQKLRRSWGSGGAIAGVSVKDALAAAELACSGDPDMQPLWRGHTENVCPNAWCSPETPPGSGAAQAARSGAPQRTPLSEQPLHQGGNAAAAAAPQGAQCTAGLVVRQQQQHRLSRAGRQEQLGWQALGPVLVGGGAGCGAEHTRLSRLRAVMTMSMLDASAECAAPMSSPAAVVRVPHVPASIMVLPWGSGVRGRGRGQPWSRVRGIWCFEVMQSSRIGNTPIPC